MSGRDPIRPEDAQHAIENARLTSTTSRPIRKVTFDDAVWHPLDHWIGSRRCREFRSDAESSVKHLIGNRHPIRYHAQLWNDCKRDSDLAWLYKYTLCWWGHHSPQTWHRTSDNSSFTVCQHCGHDLPTRSG